VSADSSVKTEDLLFLKKKKQKDVLLFFA